MGAPTLVPCPAAERHGRRPMYARLAMDDYARGLAARLEARLVDYVGAPERVGPLSLMPIGSRVRATTRLDRFAVLGAADRLVIVAKTYLVPGPPEPARPRLLPMVAAEDRATLEHRALAAIADAAASEQPAGPAAVRPLDVIDGRTVVMTELDWPSLDRFLLRQRLSTGPRGRGSGDPVTDAFRAAGAWLRWFRRLPIPTEGARFLARDEQIEAISAFGAWLADRTGSPSAAQVQRVRAAAAEQLPAELESGPGHGDFAMRNVLVGPAGRVAVIDTRARWSVPIELDLATLLVALATNRLQAATGGLAWSRAVSTRYGRAMLEGAAYPVDALPRLRLFQLLVVWDAWAAQRARTEAARAGWRARLIGSVRERRFRALGDELVRAIGGTEGRLRG